MRTAQRGPLPWRVACEPQGHLRNATRAANRLRAHEGDGAIIFQHACKMGLEGYRVEAPRSAVPQRARAKLDQGEEARQPRRAADR
jgi:hypothetical protein